MGELIAKMAVSIGRRLITEVLLSKIAVYILWHLSQLTSNKLDDKGVKAIAEALNVKDYS